MTTTTKINKVATAEVLGNIAFHAGKNRIPCQDKELMKLLEGNKIGEGIETLKAWERGWDQANLYGTK